METKPLIFLIVMIASGVAALAAFAVYLIVRFAIKGSESEGADGEARRPLARSSYGLLFAIVWLLLIALGIAFVVVLWFFGPGIGEYLTSLKLRGGGKSVTFLIMMIVLGVAALAVFLIYLLTLISRATPAGPAAPAPAEGSAAAVETPSALRLLGLLALVAAVLIWFWLDVASAAQYGLMIHLFYPAAAAVAFVLLFDKATRSWSIKGGAETFREWLLCDGIVFLFLLGYFKLMASEVGKNYNTAFWDLVHIVLFFFVLWMVDRKVTRFRFLVAYGYFLVVPILFLIGLAVQGAALPGAESWWESIWPFFFWASILFALEIVSLIITRASEGHVLGAIKEAIFVVGYAVLLIVAIPKPPE